MRFDVFSLGQSGLKLTFPGTIIYLDPYLSNSVEVLDAPDLIRQTPIPFPPEGVIDADVVLITHEHLDHCDPHTLPQVAKASPQARFIGPPPVISLLRQWGIDEERLHCASEDSLELSQDIQAIAIPAAHPEITRDVNGHLVAVGYLINYVGKKIYIAGDTFARQEIIDRLNSLGPLEVAFLPVNEHNFFRGRRGILGNMSIREAFQFAQEIGVKQVVPVHWDMFEINAVDPEEIRLIHRRTNPGFELRMNPTHINLGGLQASIVIRTLNEARYLGDLLNGIRKQKAEGINYEIVLVDSGSTDATLAIAECHGCRILHITREEFSFGRALNIGCAAAQGDILVITSGHCVPTDEYWLARLCQPLLDGDAEYVYGRQYSGPEGHYSESRIFAKYFPQHSKIPQKEFFCNNANSALLKTVWQTYQFDEDLTGLEDMDFAQRMQRDGGRVAYIADAGVFHHHTETWSQVRRRFEREALALQKIMPQVHVNVFDTVRYIVSSIWRDWRTAKKTGTKPDHKSIVCYRTNQFIGVLKGNHQHRKLSHAEKEKYFYPS